MTSFPLDTIKVKITRNVAGWAVVIEDTTGDIRFRAQSPDAVSKLVAAAIRKMLEKQRDYGAAP